MAQMPFAEHNNMVKTIPSDRTDESLRIPILPWRPRRNRSIPDTHGRSAENPFVQLLCAETAATVDEMRTTLHRNFATLHDYARCGEMPPLELRLQYKSQSSAVIERCTLLASRIFKSTGAAGLSDELPFGRILADLMAARQHISNQYDYYGSNWGAAMFGLESKDLLV